MGPSGSSSICLTIYGEDVASRHFMPLRAVPDEGAKSGHGPLTDPGVPQVWATKIIGLQGLQALLFVEPLIVGVLTRQFIDIQQGNPDWTMRNTRPTCQLEGDRPACRPAYQQQGTSSLCYIQFLNVVFHEGGQR